MEDQLLVVFARDAGGFPLRTLLGAVRSAGYPAAVSIGIAGEATEAELDSEDWDAAFLRWTEPELHDVALIERDVRRASLEAQALIATTLKSVMNGDDPAGQLIVADQLRNTEAVYAVQVLPALVDDEDHAAWAALDIVLRCIATEANGMIAVPGEGYCDADGELLLAENEIDETKEDIDQEEPEQA